MAALDRVGIVAHAGKRASNLSGGQQQRAAIARTIVQGAKVILADEPIASLDPASSRKVMDNLARVNRDDGVTVSGIPASGGLCAHLLPAHHRHARWRSDF